MIAASEATLRSVASALRSVLGFCVGHFRDWWQRWTAVPPLPALKFQFDERPPAPQLLSSAPLTIPSNSTEVTEKSMIVRRQPKAGAVQPLPRTFSTRRAPVVYAPVHSHRRCTSSSGTASTASAFYTTPAAKQQQQQQQQEPQERGSLNARESLAVALRCAIVRKEVRSVKALLENRSDIVASILTHWSDSFGCSIIHTAAATADPAVVEEILKHVPETDLKSVVNCPGPQGQTALHIACTKHSLALSEILLQRGADPNTCTKLDTRPLHLATGVSDTELCQLLLEYGADPNCVSKVGAIPLLTAVHLRNDQIVRLLLEHGANPRMSSEDGVNARALAMRMNEKGLLRMIEDTIRVHGHQRQSSRASQ